MNRLIFKQVKHREVNVSDVLDGLDEILFILNGKYDTVVEERMELEDNGEDSSGYDYQITDIEDQMYRIEEAKEILTHTIL